MILGRSPIRLKNALLGASVFGVLSGTLLSAGDELSAAPSVADQQRMLRRTIRHDEVAKNTFGLAQFADTDRIANLSKIRRRNLARALRAL